MKKTLCIIAFLASVFALFGIVGGVENGETLRNMIWCLPCVVIMFVSAKIISDKGSDE